MNHFNEPASRFITIKELEKSLISEIDPLAPSSPSSTLLSTSCLDTSLKLGKNFWEQSKDWSFPIRSDRPRGLHWGPFHHQRQSRKRKASNDKTKKIIVILRPPPPPPSPLIVRIKLGSHLRQHQNLTGLLEVDVLLKSAPKPRITLCAASRIKYCSWFIYCFFPSWVVSVFGWCISLQLTSLDDCFLFLFLFLFCWFFVFFHNIYDIFLINSRLKDIVQEERKSFNINFMQFQSLSVLFVFVFFVVVFFCSN